MLIYLKLSPGIIQTSDAQSGVFQQVLECAGKNETQIAQISQYITMTTQGSTPTTIMSPRQLYKHNFIKGQDSCLGFWHVMLYVYGDCYVTP